MQEVKFVVGVNFQDIFDVKVTEVRERRFDPKTGEQYDNITYNETYFIKGKEIDAFSALKKVNLSVYSYIKTSIFLFSSEYY
jgi:hypothetical protein